ncbi:putative tyrosine recombinase [Triplophysa rosa]|uniref:Tyrosine recombinase n=1 Tax=Triplophysa rosa TaxID=992332 RepID=A0A9W7WVP1_TRIRA|nr:putative tyrosine recombinase [Triplophysa rosa]
MTDPPSLPSLQEIPNQNHIGSSLRRRIQPPSYTRLVPKVLLLSGIPADHFSSHSFRIGAATTAAQKGLSQSQIQALGRWTSEAFKSYISGRPHHHSNRLSNHQGFHSRPVASGASAHISGSAAEDSTAEANSAAATALAEACASIATIAISIFKATSAEASTSSQCRNQHSRSDCLSRGQHFHLKRRHQHHGKQLSQQRPALPSQAWKASIAAVTATAEVSTSIPSVESQHRRSDYLGRDQHFHSSIEANIASAEASFSISSMKASAATRSIQSKRRSQRRRSDRLRRGPCFYLKR